MTQAWAGDLDILATSGWLSETPAPFRDAVLRRCGLRRYRQGDAIYRAGDPPGGLYGLVEGGVGVELSPDHREPYIGTFARPGFWIGEGSLLTHGPRFIGIRATRDSLLAHLPITEWEAIVRSDPEAWRWVALLSLRSGLMAVAVVDALMTPGATGRLAAILLVLSGQGPPDGATTIDVSQEALARMANLSRSTTGRVLHDFETRRLIESAYRQIRILDPIGLREAKGRRDPDDRRTPAPLR